MSRELQRAGAGLPALETALIKGLLTFRSAFTSQKRNLGRFKQESQLLCQFAEDTDIGLASQVQLIPRLMGLEDSSRNWSLLMVLEHLWMVNSDILKIVEALGRDVSPRGVLDIADYKPDPDVGIDVLDRFRMVNRDLEIEIRRRQKTRTVAQMQHPWFGRLDAHGWLCLAAMHQRLHRRQAQKILAMIGRV